LDRIIVALDVSGTAAALDMVDRLGDSISFFKVGKQLFTRAGPEVVKELRKRGKRVFLDLKYHDIPNTVALAVEAAGELEVDMLTIHAAGGAPMIRAARAAAGDDGPRILAVTVLTSIGAADAEQVWGRPVVSMSDEVLRLAALAADAGAHGVIASPLEAQAVRQQQAPGFLIVTPGIRPADSAGDDQVRTATAGAAVRAGADYIVVGRPITESADPAAAARRMHDDIAVQVLTL
jgi:orotidine-5'-phosphate decarboxylase